MRRKLLSTLKVTGLAVLLCLAGLVIWNFSPNSSAPFADDPAVTYANLAYGETGSYSEGYFDHKGQKLHYVEAGDGPLVILIHGFPSYWLGMIKQMEALKSDYRVVAIDTLGAGRSDAPRDVSFYTLEKTTEHLNALIDHIGGDETVKIIGHDWGGAFGFAYAQAYPDHVDRVVGISSPPPTVLLNLLETNITQREKSAYVETFNGANPILLLALGASDKIWQGAYQPLFEAEKITDEESELFRQNFKNPKKINAFLNWYRANIPKFSTISEDDYWPSKQARFDMPILLVHGADDLVFVPQYIDETKKISVTSKVIELEGVGHWPHVEARAVVNTAILDFFEPQRNKETNKD